MYRYLFFVFLIASSTLFSQSKIMVKRAGDLQPIANAQLICNGKVLGKTNAAGELTFRTKCNKIEVKASGFFADEVVVDDVMEITLTARDPKTQSIQSVIINDESDPLALKILDRVNDLYDENAPQSLDSYAFKSYEKISLDIDEDSISAYKISLEKRLDSLKNLPTPSQSASQKKDSIESINVSKLMADSKLFLWERASEYLYSKKHGEKVNILDNRVAGLQQPIYEMMTLRSNRNRIPREIKKENRPLYRFFLTDSLDIEGRKNYVIRFRQVDNKQPVNRRKYNGYLYVDAETYAVKKIESSSHKKSEGSITSIWTPVNNKWFLQKEDLKIRMGSTNFNEDKKDEEAKKNTKKFGNYVFMTADYFDFQTPIQQDKNDFSGYTMSVKNSDGKSLDLFRTDSLTARERLTYEKIDSVGKKYKLDQKINGFTSLIRGKFRVGMVDFDIAQLAKYNLYEGIRVGIGAKLNERFHSYISPDAYIAYGFKDRGWKYGAGLDIKTTLEKNSFFRAEYYNDVLTAGRFNEDLWNFRMKFMNAGIDINNDRFYGYQGFKLSYENDLTNDLTLKVSAKRDKEEALFDYDFNGQTGEFDNFATKVTLKYSPNSKNIMTPAGKFTYEQKYPEFYFNYEQGLEALGGDLSYSRFDVLAQHVFTTKAGVTEVRAYAGMVTGDVPIWHHFAMNGHGKGGDGLNLNLTSFLGFATMESGRYYNDKFVGYYLTHRLPLYFRTFGKNISSFDVVYRGIIGNMDDPSQHNFDFEKLDRLYQEVGLETNHILGTPFNLGFFYRVGHYATPTFKQNFAIQLKLNILGF